MNSTPWGRKTSDTCPNWNQSRCLRLFRIWNAREKCWSAKDRRKISNILRKKKEQVKAILNCLRSVNYRNKNKWLIFIERERTNRWHFHKWMCWNAWSKLLNHWYLFQRNQLFISLGLNDRTQNYNLTSTVFLNYIFYTYNNLKGNYNL